MKPESAVNTRRMYTDLAWAWPIISPPSDYKEETELFSAIIKEHSKIEVKTLLHLGCGGGHNDYWFKNHFTVTGVDISRDMLKLARSLNPDVAYHYGDMRTVRLGTQFDAVAILDSIAYMVSEKELKDAFTTAYHHLRPGGIFLTQVELHAGHFNQNNTRCSTHAQNDTEIVFIENYYDPDTTDTTCESTFIYLIRRHGNLEIYTDHHICGIFPLKTWIDLLTETGFKVKQMKVEHSTFAEGEFYPLLICTKPL